jgi:hypothetical protein
MADMALLALFTGCGGSCGRQPDVIRSTPSGDDRHVYLCSTYGCCVMAVVRGSRAMALDGDGNLTGKGIQRNLGLQVGEEVLHSSLGGVKTMFIAHAELVTDRHHLLNTMLTCLVSDK